MELSEECIERIKGAARELVTGTLTIKIQARPEDLRNYDVVFGVEERVRFEKGLPTSATARRYPADKM
jgi:hypothetical protein